MIKKCRIFDCHCRIKLNTGIPFVSPSLYAMVFAVWSNTFDLPWDAAEPFVPTFPLQLVSGWFHLLCSIHDHKLTGDVYFHNVDDSCKTYIHRFNVLDVNKQKSLLLLKMSLRNSISFTCLQEVENWDPLQYRQEMFMFDFPMSAYNVAALFFTNAFFGVYGDCDLSSLILILSPISLTSTS